MIRFQHGTPQQVWLSQHANGEAYTFAALEKHSSGHRPLLYVAKGSHAIYARVGDIDHTIPNFNTTLPFLLVDQCKRGPEHDPLLTSYAYSYSLASQDAAPGQFATLEPGSPPPGWLLYNGRWGDQEYPAGDARQKRLAGFSKYGGGPTGPADKQLRRKRVWPVSSHAWGQLVRTSVDGRTRIRDQIKEWWWRAFGGALGGEETRMKVRGSPMRLYADGRPAAARRG